ncbi:hypothetical protein AGMMS49975_15290 [Clostridia bacterium]|nr:hypothetical protein AGMMS49975_15290 [Clostridia bacterium]
MILHAVLQQMYRDLFYLAVDDELDVSDSDMEDYARMVRNAVIDYSNKYGGELKISDIDDMKASGDGLKKSLVGELSSMLSDKIPNEITTVVGGLLDEAAEGGGDDDSFISANGETLYWANNTIETIANYKDDYGKMKYGPSNYTKVGELAAFIANPLSFPSTLMAKFKSDRVQRILKMSQEKSDNVSSGVGNKAHFDLSGSDQFLPVELLSTAKHKPKAKADDFSIKTWGKSGGITSKVELTSAYLAMLASTSVYTPFSSHVGDSDYVAALSFLCDNAQQDDIITLFDNVKELRKPLYFSKEVLKDKDLSLYYGSSVMQNTGSAFRATLGDLVRFAEKESDARFFTVKGKFAVGTDTNSWAFYQSDFADEDSVDGTKHLNLTMDNPQIVADKTISTGQQYTDTLFEVGHGAGSVALGLLVFQNAYQQLRSTKLLEERQDSLLYMNIFGDVVLADNTVLIPGAANPLIYDLKKAAYNPYTVAFMNAYPSIVQDADSANVQGPTDKGKYVMFIKRSFLEHLGTEVKDDVAEKLPFLKSFTSSSNTYTAKQIKKIGKFNDGDLTISRVVGDGEFKRPAVKKGVSVYPFFWGGGDAYFSFLRAGYTDDLTTGEYLAAAGKHAVRTAGKYSPWGIVKGVVETATSVFTGKDTTKTEDNFDSVFISVEQGVCRIDNKPITLFPYHRDENTSSVVNESGTSKIEGYQVPILLAQNMYWYLTGDIDNIDATTSTGYSGGNIRTDYIFKNFLVEMMQGSSQVTLFEKNANIADVILDEDNDQALSIATKIARDLHDNIAEFDGVLGMSSVNTNPLFGKVVQVARDYGIYFFMFCMVIFIFRYLKRGDLLYTSTMIVMSAVFMFLFIYVFPSYLPMAYNAVGSKFTEGLVSDTLLYKAEKYSTTYGEAKAVNIQNDYDVQTVSLTLYHFGEPELRKFSERYEIPYEAYRYGGRVILNPDIGLFIQGDELKLNTDVMFLNNPITGEYQTTSNSNYSYQITSVKMSSSVLDAYCPYYQLEDGFVETLNALLSNYNIPRVTVEYVDGLTKDSFSVFNYTNSIPFLLPDDFETVPGLTPMDVLKLEQAFPNANDFLRMSDWVNEPDDKMKHTIWYRTMQKNGFYDPDFGAERRADLIEYVNYHTKRFMIENQPLVGLVSDENLIKIISLEATFYFDGRISDIGSWVYPLGFNQDELKLNDVFLTALTANNERFVKHNFDVVSYIGNAFGFPGILLFIVIMAASLAFVVAVKFSLPFLYLLLALLISYRLIVDKKISDVLRGYAKVTLAVIGIYTASIVAIACVPKILPGMTMLIALAAILLILLITLVTVMYGFLKDPFRMGNEGIGEALRRNPVTGLFANPISQAFERGRNDMRTSAAAYEASAGTEEAPSSIQTSNRQYIMRSFEDA